MTALAVEQLPRLAKYELIEELGHGGMATVYRARDKRLGREVALKVIHKHLRSNSEVGRRFTAEAQTVAKLRHANIVEIYDVSDDDSPLRYLTAELVRGQSLRQILTDRGRLPAEVAACIGVELASALAHAHERGVVHRDVKPENVLFGLPWADGQESSEPAIAAIKLTDFGIAKLLDQQGVTATGQVLGSPAYMAPEQLECTTIDVRADIYSLGVLLYECMVGRLPFDGKTPAQVLRSVLAGKFSPAEREQPSVGSRWSAILQHTLRSAPEERPASMVELRAALLAELDALGFSETTREVTAFLRDPAAYEQQLPDRLVPRLLDRGEKARKKRDVVGAAADINRAAVFAPRDPRVVTLLRSLTRDQSLDRARHWALGVAAGLALVGGGAATAWRLRAPTVRPVARSFEMASWYRAALDSAVSSAPTAAVSVAGATSSAPAASSVGGHRLASPTIGPRADGGAPPEPEERAVRFSVFPPGALLRLDEEDLPDTPGLTRMLKIGSRHTLRAYLPQPLPCCETSSDVPFVVVAPPESNKTMAQTSSAVLKTRPAQLRSEGPAGFQVSCPTLPLAISPAKGTYTIEIPSQLTKPGTCYLLDGSRDVGSQDVRLKAGETTTVLWSLAPKK
jgi:serine/threonine-protein kinase